MVESVDSLKLAQRLNHVWADSATPLKVLLQMNTSGEQSLRFSLEFRSNILSFQGKSGFHAIDQIVEAVGAIRALPHIEFCGLMTIGNPVDSTQDFQVGFQFFYFLHKVFRFPFVHCVCNFFVQINQIPLQLLGQARNAVCTAHSLDPAKVELSMGMSSDYVQAVSVCVWWVCGLVRC
jgi:uncharacterized pyridoxal phosphate-containing UPF0001 family protein